MRLRRVMTCPGHLLMGGSPRWAYCRISGGSRKSFAGIGLDPSCQMKREEAVRFEVTVYIIFRVYNSYLSSHTPNSTNHPYGGYSWARTPPRSAGACTRAPSRVRYYWSARVVGAGPGRPSVPVPVEPAGQPLACTVRSAPGRRRSAGSGDGWRLRVQPDSGVVRGSQSHPSQGRVANATSRCWWHVRRSLQPAASARLSPLQARPICPSVPPGRRLRSASRPRFRRVVPSVPAGCCPTG